VSPAGAETATEETRVCDRTKNTSMDVPYRLTRMQFLFSLLGGLPGTALCQPSSGLARELQQRFANEGLALVRIRDNWMGFFIGGGNTITRNPKGNSVAWFSANGDFVAWWILNSPVIIHSCPGSIAVAGRDGRLLWQLPGGFRGGGELIQTLGLSQDGRRVALYAENVSGQRAAHVIGPVDLSLQWVDITTMKMVQISEPSRADDVGSISWAPNGNSFVFDRAGKIFIYDLASHRTLAVADGRDPTWSPDGKQIAFRTEEGRAVAINPTTLEKKAFLGNRKILSAVQWSPDSRYVLATEPASTVDKVTHLDPSVSAITRVYKLSDMSSVTVDTINIDSLDDRGRWWFWILDYPGFLRGAGTALPLRCGP